MAGQRPLRILSLDGGGVRGIATLILLREVMAQIPRELGRPSEKGELLRPCDYFDLICGTSTGGLIAIMLGRLRYTVQDAIDVYLSLAETVFTSISSDTDAAFDHKVLEEQIKGVISNAPDNPDKHAEFADPDLADWNTSISPRGCRTFVVALQTRGTGDNATLLRSYGTPLDSPSPGRIWEVCRATSAAPTFFSPINIDRIKYGDGGLVANNPTRLAIQEASEIWPGRSIGCLLSLGTGKAAPNQLVEKENLPRRGWAGRIFASLAPKSRFQLEVAKWCVQNITRCAKVHNDILANVDRDGLRDTYFRLDTPDIGNIGLEEWERMDDMIALAKGYMAPRHMRELKSTIAKQIIQSALLPPQSSYSAPRGEHQAHISSLMPQPSAAAIGYTQAQNDSGTTGDSSTASIECSISRCVPVSSLLCVSRSLTNIADAFQRVRTRSPGLNRLWPQLLALKANFRQAIWEVIYPFIQPDLRQSLKFLESHEESGGHLAVEEIANAADLNELHDIVIRSEVDLKYLADRCCVTDSSSAHVLSADDTYISPLLRALSNLQMELRNLRALVARMKRSRKGDSQSPATSKEHFSDTLKVIPQPPLEQINQKLSQYRRVESVSTRLYYALQRACKDHTEHVAHLRLQPHHLISSGNERFIEFKLRFSGEYKKRSSTWQSNNAVWLTIQSSAWDTLPTECEKREVSSNGKSISVKRPHKDDEQACSKKMKHSTQLKPQPLDKRDVTDHVEQTKLRSCGSMIASRGPGHHASLAARQDFCMRMRKYNQDTVENPQLYLGYLEINHDEIHNVSFSDAYLTHGRSEPIALTQVLRTFFTRRNTESMPHERVELAKQLASAMLQFQRTPLLYENWSSDDIMFFGRLQDRIEAEEVFRGPHLNVCIRGKPKLGHEQENTNEDKDEQRVSEEFIFRQSLFELAIMLIEIAFQEPLADLVSPRKPDNAEDSLGYETNHHDEKWSIHDQARWFAADKLCDDVAARLGTDYRDVVRKCLDSCLDQGENNMRDKEYNAFIYTSVINMLEEIQAWMIGEDWQVT